MSKINYFEIEGTVVNVYSISYKTQIIDIDIGSTNQPMLVKCLKYTGYIDRQRIGEDVVIKGIVMTIRQDKTVLVATHIVELGKPLPMAILATCEEELRLIAGGENV